MPHRSSRFSAAIFSGLLFFLSVFPASSHALTFNVNHTPDLTDADPGDGICDALPPNNLCTLRAAIQEANHYPGIQVIILPAGVFSLTIPGEGEDEAATGDLDIREGISLSGDRSGGTVIQGGAAPGELGDRVFHVLAPSVTLRQLTIRNGSGNPAGILVDGVFLRLVDVRVTGNQGEGISGHGGLTLLEGFVSNNTGAGIDFSGSSLHLSRFSISGNGGPGIRLLDGDLILRDASITGNSGGGVFLRGGAHSLSGVTLRGNSSAVPGGGIFAESTAATILGSVIEENVSDDSGGGIYQTGTLILSDTRVSGNSSPEGGGIFQEGTLVISASTVDSNKTSGSGGGLYQAGSLYLTGSTVSGNTADASGGGVFYGVFPGSGEFKITGSTVTDNRSAGGGGIYSASSNPVVLKNSILAFNEAGSGDPDCHVTPGGTAQSLGYNLLGIQEGCPLTVGPGDKIGTPAEPVDPLLEPLAFNGGLTPTRLPMSGSPAIDSGDPTGCTDHNGALLEIDQRGFLRHVDGGGGLPRCDMGAVEFDAPGITVTPVGGIETPEPGGVAEFTIVLESRPTSGVRVDFWSSDPTQGIPSPEFVYFDESNWSEPRIIQVYGRDDLLQDGNVVYTIHTNPAVSGDPKYSGFDPADVEVASIDNDTAGIRVSPTQGLVTSELGSSAPFSVVLNTQPIDNVTLTFSVSDPNEGHVSPTSVVFSPGNWEVPRTVTVTGADDFIVDGPILYKVITNPAESADPRYNGMNPEDVSVKNLDDDSPGITVNPTLGLVTTESGGTDTFTVVLHSRPAAPVSIAFESDQPAEGTVFPDILVFDERNWNLPQPVTVSGVDDLDRGNPWDGDRGYTVLTKPANSLDPQYHGKDPSDVEVVNRDNDVRGITVTLLSEPVTTEFGGKAKFSIVLDYPPASEVSINFGSSDPTEGAVEPSGVIFNPDNWNEPRIIEITGVNDELYDGDIPYTVYIHPAVSDDPNYSRMDPEDLTLVNLERESRPVPAQADPFPNGPGGCGFIQGGGPGGPTPPFSAAAGLMVLLLRRLLRNFHKTPALR